MSARSCIIHVGTHKTGTTSLQIFVQENVRALQTAGLYVAQSGRLGALPGNHELAWELLGGTSGPLFARLVEELQASPSRTALLSSEDFSLLYAHPRTLDSLANRLRSIGYDPKIVLYLRAQAPYIESMYVERIKHGYVRPLAQYLETILRTGHYLPEGTQQNLQFEYTRLSEPFIRTFGEQNVAVRAYVPGNDPAAIFYDFLAVLRAFDPLLQSAPLALRASRPLENPSLSFGALLATLHRKLRPNQTCSPEELFREPEFPLSLVDSRFALLQHEEYERCLERFADDNREIARLYGAQVPFTAEADVLPSGDSHWERAHLQRVWFDRSLAAWSR